MLVTLVKVQMVLRTVDLGFVSAEARGGAMGAVGSVLDA